MAASSCPRSKAEQLLGVLSSHPEDNAQLDLEGRRACLQALGSMLAAREEALPKDMLPEVAARLLDVLASHCSSGALPVDRPFSRYFYTLLRTLQAAVRQINSLQALPLAALVDCLKRFWTYGLAAASPFPAAQPLREKNSISSTPVASPRIGSYRPPHLRTRQRSPPPVGERWRKQADDGSASECSDTECGAATPDPYRASQARLASLTCLQSMAKQDGRLLHPLWTALFPVYTPLSIKPSMATLMDVMVIDPQPKVRVAAAAAAAALLEGPRQRAYLAIAEHREHAQLRGFTTLSAVLGKMAVCTHDALLQALSCEADSAALTAVLRFAATLCGAAPYHRLPCSLLPRSLQNMQRVIEERLPLLASCADELAIMQCAALSCVAALLAAQAGLSTSANGATRKGTQEAGAALPAGLCALLADLAGSISAAVTAEALAALQPIARAQPDALHSCWAGVRAVLLQSLDACGTAGDAPGAATLALLETGVEHSAVQGLRLLALYLKAWTEQCDTAQSNGSGKMPSVAARNTARECIAQEWEFVCSDVLPQCVAMRGLPTVQCAALGVLGSLTDSAYSRLSLAQQRLVWQALHSHSASEPGSASAAHVAALKAAGALVLCPASRRYPGLPAMVEHMQAGLNSSTTSVQVAAAGALANAADAAAGTAGAGLHPADITALIAQAALVAANASEKAQAHAIRALGYLLASDSLLCSSACNGREAWPAWVQQGLETLCIALRSSNVKVQWNACYAAGAVLRSTHVAPAVAACGLMNQILLCLLHALQNSDNFKTRAHAAASLAQLRDLSLLRTMRPSAVVQSLEAAAAVLQREAGEDCRAEVPSVDVTNIQSFHVLQQQLHDTISHFKILQASQDCNSLVGQ
ncbi:hypothetical protein CVIRNUC_002567 [Coccomyxa viridis]|uniref:DUF4042 domain-containing protein n=1 Tax=Coccomyxa viridis TaxID=1274662 RepID=A0AAV1HYS7_9CHLO|nr:hypothetical protein CVIRNUC_002567 [Coccomyxa viridis]